MCVFLYVCVCVTAMCAKRVKEVWGTSNPRKKIRMCVFLLSFSNGSYLGRHNGPWMDGRQAGRHRHRGLFIHCRNIEPAG